MGNYLKAFHIIFVVTWFAGLFYMVRLFVHYVEAQTKPHLEKEILQKQYQKMAKGLWLGITYPSMILTLIFGFSLVHYFNYWREPWMHLKFFFVLGLLFYHFYCGILYGKMQAGTLNASSFILRLYNELATVFLFAIVFTVVFKYAIFQSQLGLGILVLAILLLISVYLFKISRQNSKKSNL